VSLLPQAGVTPAVFFTPVNFVATGEPIGMLADPVDFATGELLSIARGFDPTDAAVFTALRTVKASGSAVEDVGHNFRDAKLITPQLESFFREEVRLALDHLTSTKQISLERVEYVEVGDTVEIQVHYFNVARSQARMVPLALNQLLGRAVS
jgi:hypothetical protein